jgi:hypothetical protein
MERGLLAPRAPPAVGLPRRRALRAHAAAAAGRRPLRIKVGGAGPRRCPWRACKQGAAWAAAGAAHGAQALQELRQPRPTWPPPAPCAQGLSYWRPDSSGAARSLRSRHALRPFGRAPAARLPPAAAARIDDGAHDGDAQHWGRCVAAAQQPAPALSRSRCARAACAWRSRCVRPRPLPPPSLPPPATACRRAASAARAPYASGARPTAFSVTSPVSGTTYSILMRRALTARQAASLLRTGRLYASHRRAGWLPAALGRGGAGTDSDTDAGSEDGRPGLGRSHPVSVPASQRASDADGAGAASRPGSVGGSSVLGGVPALPPRAHGGLRTRSPAPRCMAAAPPVELPPRRTARTGRLYREVAVLNNPPFWPLLQTARLAAPAGRGPGHAATAAGAAEARLRRRLPAAVVAAQGVVDAHPGGGDAAGPAQPAGQGWGLARCGLGLAWTLPTRWGTRDRQMIDPSASHLAFLSVRDQLPALLLWLASADGDKDGPGNSMLRARALASALTPQQLEELSRSLRAPTAALAVFTQFLRAQQALEGTPATLGQVGEAARGSGRSAASAAASAALDNFALCCAGLKATAPDTCSANPAPSPPSCATTTLLPHRSWSTCALRTASRPCSPASTWMPQAPRPQPR